MVSFYRSTAPLAHYEGVKRGLYGLGFIRGGGLYVPVLNRNGGCCLKNKLPSIQLQDK